LKILLLIGIGGCNFFENESQSFTRGQTDKVMMIWLAFKNIWRAKTRTILTLTGVGAGIALYVSLISISTDLKQQLDQAVTRSNIDIIVQEKGSATPVASRIDQKTVTAIGELDKVKSVTAVTVGSISARGLPYLFLFGISGAQSYLSMTDWLGTGVIAGTLFVPGKKQVMLGRSAARALEKNVGDTVILGAGHEYRVCGIYWLGQGILDGGAVMHLNDSQHLLKRTGYVNLVMVQGHSTQHTTTLVREIAHAFPELEPSPAASLRGRIRAISMIDGFVTAVSVIALLLSGILILNTLLMAISERTREIGVLMAVGWSRWRIVRLIVSEAVILGIIGGVVGFGAAFPTLSLIQLLPAMGPGWIASVPSPVHFFTAVALSAAVAAISSFYPALFATRLVPAEALRYE
jgi:putative ABC transport system permease protein